MELGWDHVMNTDIRKRLGVMPIAEKMREARLRWYGHAVRSEEDSVAKTAMRLSPPGRRPRRRPKKRWLDRLAEDMKIVGAAPDDAHNRAKWRLFAVVRTLLRRETRQDEEEDIFSEPW